jgi:hypothetical protein
MLSKMNLISVVQQLPKEDIETIQGYVEMIEEKNQELKEELEESKDNYNCLLNQKKQFEYIMSKQVDYQGQQIEFILYLRHLSNWYSTDGVKQGIVNEILQKYREIIGVSDEKK